MKTAWRVELPQILLIAAMFAAAAFMWSSAPAQIPVHWNGSGQIDRYGGRFEGLLLLPLMALGLYLLLRFLPMLDPGRANYARFGGAYATIRIGILTLLALIYTVVLVSITRGPVNMSSVAPFLLGGLFLLIGSVMGKLRPNWFVGVRTPWTLSSKTSWVRTHRLGGWLFMAQGLIFIVCGVLGFGKLGPTVIGSMLVIVVVLMAYSYIVWRDDPEKQAPAGTQPADDD
jgi:uncharacterized membrane protein